MSMSENVNSEDKYGIIADSCCDVTPQLRDRLGVLSVPLHLYLGDSQFIDDDTLDMSDFMSKMKLCKEKIGTASPSPDSYKKAFLEAGHSFVVTLSSKLSGSFMCADVARQMAEDEGAVAHIFDSLSASAGELLIVIKLRELIDAGFKKHDIVPRIDKMIKDMRTLFVLENLDNLVKNGRMSKIQEKICVIANIRPMFQACKGEIALLAKVRGEKQAIERFTKEIEISRQDTSDKTIVIAHCGNYGFAQKLKDSISQKFNFKEILVVATNGVSSLYANDKGIIVAF